MEEKSQADRQAERQAESQAAERQKKIQETYLEERWQAFNRCTRKIQQANVEFGEELREIIQKRDDAIQAEALREIIEKREEAIQAATQEASENGERTGEG